ncbi:carbohydrate sulfotransferase 4 [Drosophila tropicalis]|uniref:carbohydrate sulfotransferase 4 n=1 Tax=Drosophila tropicalis TaxID=46794 RepID=UPI0035AC24D3
MVEATRTKKFVGVCIALYVSYALFVFVLLPMLLPDPVTMHRAIVAYQTRHLGNLSKYTLDKGGQPIRSMLVTFRGSGALSLLHNLSHQPGCYHHYAPLVAYHSRFSAEQHAEQALDELVSLYSCNYNQSAQSMLKSGMASYSFRRFYGVQWKSCSTYPQDVCWDSKTIEHICKLFPFINMSVYNLRLKYLAMLLEKKDLNIRILLLVRDPRGTMQSRSKRIWCIGNSDCDDPSVLCKDMVSDYVISKKLIKEYPLNFGIIRYEDLAEHTAEVLPQIFDFYGIPFKRNEESLTGHPRFSELSDKESGDASSMNEFDQQFPNQPAFEWITQLSANQVRAIQKAPHCKEAMQMWGYRRINYDKDFSVDSFSSIIRKPLFS